MTRSTGPVAGLLAGAAALAVLLPPAAATAQAPAPTDAAGAWLAGQLVDGDHLASEVGGQSYVNYGPTADVALGLLATGAEPATLEAVLDFLTDSRRSVDAYMHGVGRPRPTPARSAKLGLTTTHGRPATRDAVGGTDLVVRTRGPRGRHGPLHATSRPTATSRTCSASPSACSSSTPPTASDPSGYRGASSSSDAQLRRRWLPAGRSARRPASRASTPPASRCRRWSPSTRLPRRGPMRSRG